MLDRESDPVDHMESALALSRRTPLKSGQPLTRKSPIRNTTSRPREKRNTPQGRGDGPAEGGSGRAVDPQQPNTQQQNQTNEATGSRVGVTPAPRRGAGTLTTETPIRLDLEAAARALAYRAVSAAQPRREATPLPKPGKPAKRIARGFPPAVRQAIIERDRFQCVRCGINTDTDGWPGYSLQHRDNRGSGGTDDPRVNRAGNGALMCGSGTTGCHGWTEDNETAAARMGWVVRSWADPTSVPMYVHGRGWVLLDHAGGLRMVAEPPGGDAHAVAARKEAFK